MKDFYYILGIDPNSTPDEIREAYRKLSKKFHPDLNQNDKYFESRFRDIQEAYETLIDQAKRRRYDEALNRSKTNFFDDENAKKRYSTGNKGVDVAFTIILILVTLMFGDYVIKSITASKTVKNEKEPVFSAVYFKSPVRHKKKHNLKTMLSAKAVSNASSGLHSSFRKITTDTQKKLPVIKMPVNDKKIDDAETVTNNDAGPNTALSYTSYIRSNITGVVNMRKFENLNSEIVNVIPTNSKVVVLGKGKAYYKVQFNNAVGYVPKWTIKTK